VWADGVWASIAAAASLYVCPVAAQSVTPSSIALPAVRDSAPTIDGRISVAEWERGALVELPYQWFPDDGSAPTVHTSCRVMVNGDAILVGCIAYDPDPRQIVAPRRDRDAGSGDDGIAVTIDPYGDGREGFVFRVNASGVLLDAQLGRISGTDYRWDAVWRGQSGRRPDGYAVELAIPFSSIRMPGVSQAQPPRLQIERVYPRRHAYVMGATALNRNEQCRTCQGLPVSLPTINSSGHGLLIQPTFIAANQRSGLNGDGSIDLGGAMRWQATPDTRIGVTINPDFSQVEADELDFEINRRFVLTFDERRPFFLEGRDMLESYGNLVFSRRIANPEWGIRALNRTSARSVAVLLTREETDTRIIPGPYSSSSVSGNGGATTGVARVQVLPNQRLTFGSTLTVRDAAQSHNVVGDVDADLQLADRHRLRFVAAIAGSGYDSAASDTMHGTMAQARYDLATRSWAAEISMRAISPGFRADAGLLQRVDIWGPELQLNRMFWGTERTWYSLITATVDAQYLQTFSGHVADGKAGPKITWQGPRQSRLGIALTGRQSNIDSATYGYVQAELTGAIRPSSRWSGDFQITAGKQPDVINERLGNLYAGRLSVALSPHDAVSVTAVGRYEKLLAQTAWVYRASIADIRLEIYPRLNTRLRLVAQYSATDRNPDGGIVDGSPRRNGFTFQGVGSQRFGTRALAFVGFVGSGSVLEGSPRWPGNRSVFAKVAWDFAH
jgi:hypothetical protein